MKHIYFISIVTLIAYLLPITLSAENYPYRADVLWVTVPDHADWLYKTGENPTIDIQLYKYGVPVDDAKLSYEIGGDMAVPTNSSFDCCIIIAPSNSLSKSETVWVETIIV